MSASIWERRAASSRVLSLASTLARPMLGLTPMRRRVSPCLANTSLKYTDTAWPKMMGSDTFIMVAFRCSDTITSCALASCSCSSKNARSSRAFMTEASRISFSMTARPDFRTVFLPCASTWVIWIFVSLGTTYDFSLPKKSPDFMWATWVLDTGGQGRMRTGGRLRCAFFFTGSATRRSELPSRSTGLTALPSTLAYAAAMAFSSSVLGS
mmetsp:Transcript_33551/g.84234  ORF Transcript_33551/g.84234 Transcript_33551/m.84234 type:complete len:211 (+) Transcript_33551:1344-1976(+)